MIHSKTTLRKRRRQYAVAVNGFCNSMQMTVLKANSIEKNEFASKTKFTFKATKKYRRSLVPYGLKMSSTILLSNAGQICIFGAVVDSAHTAVAAWPGELIPVSRVERSAFHLLPSAEVDPLNLGGLRAS